MANRFKNTLILGLATVTIISSTMPSLSAFAEDDSVDNGYSNTNNGSTNSSSNSADSGVDSGFDEEFYAANDILIYDPRGSLCSYSTNSGSTTNYINSATVDKSFTLGTDSSLRAVNLAKQLKADFSLTDAQAAGIVGNFMHESGGANLPPDVNEGGKAGPPMFKGGYGWAQWTGGRQTTFIKYSISNGYMGSNSDHATDAANYAYLKYELINTETSTIPAVAKTSTPKDAATAYEAAFERAGVPALEKRIAHAESVYAALQAGTGVAAASATTATPATASSCPQTGAGVATGGQIFDTVVFPLSVNKKTVVNQKIFHDNTTERAGHPYIAFDILAPAGTQVVALAEGEIANVKPDGSLGGSVTIYNKSKDLHVFYTHMRPLNTLKVGQAITPGTPIGNLLSVKNYPKINADHLHIDAGHGKVRLGCSRTNPTGAACNTRVNIGPDLYNAWQKVSP